MKTSAFISTALLSASFAFSLAPDTHAAAVDNRDVVHDMRGQVVRSTNGNCVRTRWISADDECRGAQMAQVRKPERRRIADEARTVYFEFDKTRLMGSEQDKLNSLASTLKEMKEISSVSIVGYADRIGTRSYNERLSKQRARVVEKYLRQRGYLNATVAKTRWLGESVPLTACAGNLGRVALIACLQKDRRVTVEIKYEDEQSGSNINH